MKKHKQYGFVHVWLIIVACIVIGLVVFAASRVINKKTATNTADNKTQQQTEQTQSTQKDELELQNIGLQSFEDINYTDQALREYSSRGLKGFYYFGDSLSGGRTNPNFEFSSIKDDAKIVAAIDGVIVFTKEQPESKDFEVFLQTSESSQWIIGYDHIVDVLVKKGDKVKAGDVLGRAALQNNGLRRFEFQVNKKQAGADDLHICPATLLAGSVKDAVTNSLKTMMDKWESTSGISTLYDTDVQNPIGCGVQTLTPAKAAGQN